MLNLFFRRIFPLTLFRFYDVRTTSDPTNIRIETLPPPYLPDLRREKKQPPRWHLSDRCVLLLCVDASIYITGIASWLHYSLRLSPYKLTSPSLQYNTLAENSRRSWSASRSWPFSPSLLPLSPLKTRTVSSTFIPRCRCICC